MTEPQSEDVLSGVNKMIDAVKEMREAMDKFIEGLIALALKYETKK